MGIMLGGEKMACSKVNQRLHISYSTIYVGNAYQLVRMPRIINMNVCGTWFKGVVSYTVCGVRTRTAAAARLSPLLHGEPSNRRRNCPARSVGSTHAAPTVPHYTERAEGAHSPTLIRKPPKNRISYFFGRLCRPVLCQLLPGALLCCC